MGHWRPCWIACWRFAFTGNHPDLAGADTQVQTAFGQTFPNALAWNWSFNLTLNWQLFQGGLTWYTVKEQKANLESLRNLHLNLNLNLSLLLFPFNGSA